MKAYICPLCRGDSPAKETCEGCNGVGNFNLQQLSYYTILLAVVKVREKDPNWNGDSAPHHMDADYSLAEYFSKRSQLTGQVTAWRCIYDRVTGLHVEFWSGMKCLLRLRGLSWGGSDTGSIALIHILQDLFPREGAYGKFHVLVKTYPMKQSWAVAVSNGALNIVKDDHAHIYKGKVELEYI